MREHPYSIQVPMEIIPWITNDLHRFPWYVVDFHWSNDIVRDEEAEKAHNDGWAYWKVRATTFRVRFAGNERWYEKRIERMDR